MVKNPIIGSCDLDLWPITWKCNRILWLSRCMFMQNIIELSATVRELSWVQRKKTNSDEHNTVRHYRYSTDSKKCNRTGGGLTGFIIPAEGRVMPGAEATAVMHHNSRQIVDKTVGLQVLAAVLLHVQLSAKLYVDWQLAAVITTRPPDNQTVIPHPHYDVCSMS